MDKIKITIISLLFLIVGSCTEEILPTPYEYTKIFTGEKSKIWKLNFLEQTLDGKVEETFNVPCAIDDEYIFYANSERAYKATTGSKKCVLQLKWTYYNFPFQFGWPLQNVQSMDP